MNVGFFNLCFPYFPISGAFTIMSRTLSILLTAFTAGDENEDLTPKSSRELVTSCKPLNLQMLKAIPI